MTKKLMLFGVMGMFVLALALVATAGDKPAGKMMGSPNCPACAEGMSCQKALTAMGATMEWVDLSNGLACITTAASPSKAMAVQTHMQKHGQKMNELMTTQRDKFCDMCKKMSSMIEAGTQQVVNFKGGTMWMVTSNDPKTVESLHQMAAECRAMNPTAEKKM